MKLIIFLIIIVFIYLVFANIKVYHANTLPDQEKQELVNKQKIKSMMTNNIKCKGQNSQPIITPKTGSTEPVVSTIDHAQAINPNPNPKVEHFGTIIGSDQDINQDSNHDITPNINDILDKVVSEYLDPRYVFNQSVQPVNTRNCNCDISDKDRHYIDHIADNIHEWHTIFRPHNKFTVSKINPLFVKEAGDEFVIMSNVKILYLGRALYLQLTYYGVINRTDDFINDGYDTYILQLIKLKVISAKDFSNTITDTNNDNQAPFMTMQDQLAYVDRVKLMHERENSYY